MIEKMLCDYKLDHSRVFVTGLSAGGAMACELLASYPDLFAAGAIIAGLPFGAALGPFDAMKAMAFAPGRSSQEWGNLVRQASPGQKKWPRISIWRGGHDEVVAPANASALVRQWIDFHQVDETSATQDEVDGQTRVSWRNSSGAVIVEHYAIDGMAHGVPIDAKMRGTSGSLAPFMLDAGISSTFHSAKSWGLLRQTAAGTKTRPPRAMAPVR